MEASTCRPAALPEARRAGTFTLVLVALLGALLPIQWFIEIGGTKVNCCAADFVMLPLALLPPRLPRRCRRPHELTQPTPNQR